MKIEEKNREPVLDIIWQMFENCEIEIQKIKYNQCEIKVGQMYNAPEISMLDTLLAFEDLFGTRKVNIDGYSYGGCETCDYGSEYGHRFTLKECTKNLDVLERLNDK